MLVIASQQQLVVLHYYQSKKRKTCSYLKTNFLNWSRTLHKIHCVNIEKPVDTKDNSSQSKERCCKWKTVVWQRKSLCTQGNCTQHFLAVGSNVNNTLIFCVDTGISLSKATITWCNLSPRLLFIDATLLCEFESDKIWINEFGKNCSR